MKKQNRKYLLLHILIVGLLVACDNAEESKQKYIQQGKSLLLEGRDIKAVLAFKNALQIDPKDVEGHFQLAETYRKQGEIKKSYGHYREVMRLDERHIISRIRVGQFFLMGKNLDTAEQLKDEVVALAPDNMDVLIFQARVEAVKNNKEAAIAIIKKVLQIDSNNISASVLLASIHAQNGELDKAIKLLKKAEEHEPDSEATQLESIHLLLVKIYASKQLKAEVENELKLLIKIKPQSLPHYKRLVIFYMSEKQDDKAEAILQSATKQFPDDESVPLLLVDFLLNNKGMQEAVDELSSLISLKPEKYSLRFKLFSMQLKMKDADAAEGTLNKIIELDGLDSAGLKARVMLARFLVTIDRAEQAKELMNFVLAENPRDAEALTLRGQFALNDKRVLDAISDFRAALVGQPDDITILKLLSSAQELNNDIVLAIENLEKIVVLAPKDTGSHQKLIKLLLVSNKLLQAEQYSNALLKIDSKNKNALESLFKVHVSKKDWDKAQKISLLYQNDLENKAKGLYMSGMAYQAEGKWEKSIGAFKQALINKPDAIQPLTQLIKTYLREKQVDNAISYLKEKLKTEQNHFIASNLLGEIYIFQEKEDLAEIAFRQSISIKPEWFNSYRNLAVLLSKKNDNVDAAVEILQQGLEKTNGSLILIEALAVIYQKQGKFDEMISLYEDAYKKTPNSVLVVNNLASYLAEYKATEENLARAAKMAILLENSENPNMLDTVAWIFYKQGNYGKAQKLLQKAVEKGSVPPELSYHLGMVFYKQGDLQSSKIHLEKALMGNVDFLNIEEARKVLKKIEGG